MRLLLAVVFAAFLAGSLHADEAEQAWRGLVDPEDARNPTFALPDLDPALPSVLIYGDSISIAYHPYVREALAGKANVYRLYTNGHHSADVIPQIKKMQEAMAPFIPDGRWPRQWDVIQLNVGLHDLKYLKDGQMVSQGGKQVHTTQEYNQHLREALDYLKKNWPDAQLIFATTTPVPENSVGRMADDAARYNEVALEVLKDYPEIIVNDLHALTKPHQSEWWTRPGNVHFNRKGQKAQGKEVARVISKVLDPQSAQ